MQFLLRLSNYQTYIKHNIWCKKHHETEQIENVFHLINRKLGPVNDPQPGQSVWGDENSDQGGGVLQGQHQRGKQSSPGVLLNVIRLSGQQRWNYWGRHSLLYQVRFINPVSWYICILKKGGVFHIFCWPFGKEKIKMIGHI